MVLVGRYNVAIGPGYIIRSYAADSGSGDVVLRVKDLGFFIVEVLSGVRGLVLEGFDELVETTCEKGAQDRTDPVDPMIKGELMQDDTGTKRAGRV